MAIGSSFRAPQRRGGCDWGTVPGVRQPAAAEPAPHGEQPGAAGDPWTCDGQVRRGCRKAFRIGPFTTRSFGPARRWHEPDRPPRWDGRLPRHGPRCRRETSCWCETMSSKGRAGLWRREQAYDGWPRAAPRTMEVTAVGEVVRAYTSSTATQMNCSGGQMPWGSWISCEETVKRPRRRAGLHRRAQQSRSPPAAWVLFEVPVDGEANRAPVTRAGRFAPRVGGVSTPAGGASTDRGRFRFA